MGVDEIVKLPDAPAPTAALVAWVQGLFPAGQEPVLVGGAAVELYTGGAYVTGDITFTGSVSPDAARALQSAGFERRGRHWVHEAVEVFVEFPTRVLREGEVAVRVRVGSCEVVAISAEDVLADCLAAWKHWNSVGDGVKAWLLFRARRETLDRKRLNNRITALGAEEALRALMMLTRRLHDREVTQEEIESWAQRGP
jgi:hypothetical protein